MRFENPSAILMDARRGNGEDEPDDVAEKANEREPSRRVRSRTRSRDGAGRAPSGPRGPGADRRGHRCRRDEQRRRLCFSRAKEERAGRRGGDRRCATVRTGSRRAHAAIFHCLGDSRYATMATVQQSSAKHVATLDPFGVVATLWIIGARWPGDPCAPGGRGRAGGRHRRRLCLRTLHPPRRRQPASGPRQSGPGRQQ